MDDNDFSRKDREDVYQPPRPMGLVSKEKSSRRTNDKAKLGLSSAYTKCQPHSKPHKKTKNLKQITMK
jgi:hypothetical protein